MLHFKCYYLIYNVIVSILMKSTIIENYFSNINPRYGKWPICRVPKICRGQLLKHMANNSFAVCHLKDAQQMLGTRQSLAVCFVLTHVALCFILAHGKVMFCCVLFFARSKGIKKFLFSPRKLFMLFTYNMWHSMLKFGKFLYLFAIFN